MEPMRGDTLGEAALSLAGRLGRAKNHTVPLNLFVRLKTYRYWDIAIQFYGSTAGRTYSAQAVLLFLRCTVFKFRLEPFGSPARLIHEAG
jgi:hypothetical protein